MIERGGWSIYTCQWEERSYTFPPCNSYCGICQLSILLLQSYHSPYMPVSTLAQRIFPLQRLLAPFSSNFSYSGELRLARVSYFTFLISLSFFTLCLYEDLDNIAKWCNLKGPCEDVFLWGFYGAKLPGLQIWDNHHFNDMVAKQRYGKPCSLKRLPY
jgi:hypothetical protein